jgi:galactofuranosylgalactofuranosylrhamnosyl-N-acetylglucosaminyl-diphospho-decaprenol beta-1,5/1,6-galactofuranosyltransferase
MPVHPLTAGPPDPPLAAAPAPADSGEPLPQEPRSVLARVVLPADGAAVALYVDGDAPDTPTSAEVLDRRRVRVPAGSRASFATWFAAFPAGWWARHTEVRRVRLDVSLSGPGRVELFRSDARGRTTALDGRTAALDDGDGGWLWFDVVAGDGDVVLERADWCADGARSTRPSGSLTLAMTTYDRPGSALGVLRRLAGEPAVLDVVDSVVVVDQGSRRVRAEPGFAEVAQSLGDRLRVVEQANLGGSGGFARGMLEALRCGRSRYLVLLDDDIVLEPESLRRALAFADRCAVPTLVSCGMLDATLPTVLHSPGDRVDRPRFLWETVPPGEPDTDLAEHGLRSTPWLHARLDVEYGGWWCCLIPVQVLREVGLSLPLFLKWDDAEFGLRAGAAGFPTVALPGAGVWHEPWTGKADTLDWQAYYHHRNRLLAALLHSPTRRGLRLLLESLEWSLVPLVAMRYSVVALRNQAIEDLLAGPEDLHASLASRVAEVRALRASYVDGRPVPAQPAASLPPARVPANRAVAIAGLVREVLRTVVRTAPDGPPQHAAGPDDARMWRLARVDSAWLTSAAGVTTEHRRDARTATRLLVRALVLHLQVLHRWPALREQYRRALPDLVSPAAWEATLAPTPPDLARRGERPAA